MGMERRIFKRFPLALNGSLFLCQGRNGSRLTKPLSCRVVDLSRRGAGILTWQIIVDNSHLFFASLGSDQVILHLAIDLENTDEPPLTLAVRPLWFDRILLNEEQQPFQMGVKFFEKIAKEDFRRLKKVVAR